MLSPLSSRMDPPAVRAGWLRMMLRVFRRYDREGLYTEMIATTQRLIAQAEAEAARPAPPRPTLLSRIAARVHQRP
jgi:hypothetical protein